MSLSMWRYDDTGYHCPHCGGKIAPASCHEDRLPAACPLCKWPVIRASTRWNPVGHYEARCGIGLTIWKRWNGLEYVRALGTNHGPLLVCPHCGEGDCHLSQYQETKP